MMITAAMPIIIYMPIGELSPVLTIFVDVVAVVAVVVFDGVSGTLVIVGTTVGFTVTVGVIVTVGVTVGVGVGILSNSPSLGYTSVV